MRSSGSCGLSRGCALNGRRQHIVAGSAQTFDSSELDQAACAAPAGQHRDQVDRFGNERARNRDDRFLDKLFEPPQRSDRGAGVDRADPARVTGAPGLQQV